ncbi:hypothetical protein [Bifidobacterium stellenboschense]|uniref:hypothetical protein n=1 Tax=Bifidobacterium stellenboschense TaxID=762211 RepID=UPI003B75C072
MQIGPHFHFFEVNKYLNINDSAVRKRRSERRGRRSPEGLMVPSVRRRQTALRGHRALPLSLLRGQIEVA